MSVQAMKFVTVTGPLPEFEAVVRQCVVDRPFHPESVLQVMHRNNHLRSLNMPNQVMPLLRQAEEVLTRLELEPEYRPFAEGADLEEGQRYLDDLTQQLDQMDQWEEALRQVEQHLQNAIDAARRGGIEPEEVRETLNVLLEGE